MTTLVTGGHGVLGREFVRVIPQALAPRSTNLDVRNAAALMRYVAENRVDTVIHCAARTNVRYCEEHGDETADVNVQGTRNICDALSAVPDARLVYISTACVFPGDDPGAAYGEDDAPSPKNEYARSKLSGEAVVDGWTRAGSRRHALIVRTNFAARGAWQHPKAFVDRFGTYLYPDIVAARVVDLLDERETGIVHVCGDKRLSMFEFARLGDPNVGRISLAEYSGPPLTVNMCLRSMRIAPLPLS